MHVKDEHQTLVIVRGINDDWKAENFISFQIRFGGNPKGVPIHDSYYVGLYLNSPESRITHIGVVHRIHRNDDPKSADFHLKFLLKLQSPLVPGHPIRKQQYFYLDDFALTEAEELILKNSRLLLKQ